MPPTRSQHRFLFTLVPLLPLSLVLAGCGDDTAALPEPSTLATGQSAPHALFADVDGLYWATGDGAVRMLEHGQSEPRTLGVDQGEVVSLAADETRVFWMLGGERGAMRHANKGGGHEPIEVVDGLATPRGVGIDDNCVFWVTADAVMAIWKEGGELITVASDRQAPADVEVDFTGIYWSDAAEGGSIWKVEVEGDAPTLVTRAKGAKRIALGPEDVFWTTDDGVVGRARKDGSEVQALSGTEEGLGALAASGTDAYWVADAGAQVRAFDAVGAAHTLAEAQAGAADIAVDDGAVYWANAGDGSLRSTPR